MVNDVSTELHTFFVPQMKQLGLVEQQCRHGSLSVLDSELGTGTLWAHSIGGQLPVHFSRPTAQRASSAH